MADPRRRTDHDHAAAQHPGPHRPPAGRVACRGHRQRAAAPRRAAHDADADLRPRPRRREHRRAHGEAFPELEGGAADALYVGAKAHLRPLHDAVLAIVDGFGPYERAPKKSDVSLRRSRQFAMVGPATRDLIEVGLNCKTLPEHPRLKLLPPGRMYQATTRIGRLDEVDGLLAGWLLTAYDAEAQRRRTAAVRRRRIRCRHGTARGRRLGFPRGLAMLGPWEVRAGCGSGVPQRMPSGAPPRPPGAPR